MLLRRAITIDGRAAEEKLPASNRAAGGVSQPCAMMLSRSCAGIGRVPAHQVSPR